MDKNELIKKLIDVFQELRSASMSIADDPRPVMQKYDLLFFGEKFNKIISTDLHEVLNSYFNIAIESNAFHELLPSVCDAISMNYEVAVNLQGSTPSCKHYLVELW